MKNIVLASAMLLASLASASAAPLAYTFADDSGNPYCDGITLKLTGGTYVGTHTGSCEAGNYAGGLAVKLKGTKDRIIDVVTTDAFSPNYVFTIILDLTDLTYAAYGEDTTDGIPYQLTNTGELLVGQDTSVVVAHSTRGSALSMRHR